MKMDYMQNYTPDGVVVVDVVVTATAALAEEGAVNVKYLLLLAFI